MTGTTLYRRLLGYVRPYWWTFALAIVGMIAVAAGDLLMAWLVIPVVQNFQSPDPERTRWLPLVIVGVFALRGAGSYVSEYGMAYTGHRVVFDLRRRLIDKLLALPTPFYDQTAAGIVQSKVTFDAHQLANAASGTITTAVRSTLTIIASFGWLLWLNWRLTLMTFVILPVVGVTIRYFSRRLRRIARDIQARTGSMTHVLEELIGGHRIVRIFGGEAWERDRAVKAANALRVSMTRQSAASAASSPITQGLAAVAVGLIVWAALAQSQDGRLDLPTFTSYVVALITLLERLKALSGINAAIQRGLAAAESIFGLLDREDEPDHGTVALDRVRGEIRCERVSLRYAGTDRDALADVSLTIAPGETVALVGASGSGKTSLVNLVPRFYEPSSGRLFVDGQDITTLTLSSLRRHIAMVSQDVLLFDDTIRANIAYGAMARADDAAVERAAAAAHALEFIRALPQGFDTPVGEQGVRLSGGQRQRIAIARALITRPKLIVADEPVSALDVSVQAQVLNLMMDLQEQFGVTYLLISHDLAVVQHLCDDVAVMQGGQIVERGSPQTLFTHPVHPYTRKLVDAVPRVSF